VGWLFGRSGVLRFIVAMGIYSRHQDTGTRVVGQFLRGYHYHSRMADCLADLLMGHWWLGRHGSCAPDMVHSGALRWGSEENIHLPTMSPIARSGRYPIPRESFGLVSYL